MNKSITEFFVSLGKGYYKPNSGGCGLFAYAASRALDSIGIEHKIVVCCWDREQADTFQENYGKVYKSVTRHYNDHLNNGKCWRAIHNHIAIEINGKLYDVSGEWEPDNIKLKAAIDIRTLKKLVRDGDQWNSTFWRNNAYTKTDLHYVARKAEKFSKSLAIR